MLFCSHWILHQNLATWYRLGSTQQHYLSQSKEYHIHCIRTGIGEKQARCHYKGWNVARALQLMLLFQPKVPQNDLIGLSRLCAIWRTAPTSSQHSASLWHAAGPTGECPTFNERLISSGSKGKLFLTSGSSVWWPNSGQTMTHEKAMN